MHTIKYSLPRGTTTGAVAAGVARRLIPQAVGRAAGTSSARDGRMIRTVVGATGRVEKRWLTCEFITPGLTRGLTTCRTDSIATFVVIATVNSRSALTSSPVALVGKGGKPLFDKILIANRYAQPLKIE